MTLENDTNPICSDDMASRFECCLNGCGEQGGKEGTPTESNEKQPAPVCNTSKRDINSSDSSSTSGEDLKPNIDRLSNSWSSTTLRRRRRRRRRRCRITIGLGWDDQRSFVCGAEMSVPMRVCSFRGGLLWGIV